MTRGLFDDQRAPRGAAAAAAGAPLAERMRPRSLDEVVGQQAVVGPDGFLRRAIAADRVPSLVFWGPPGCGKTTLACLIAEAADAEFVPFSAVTAGIAEIKRVMAEAEKLRRAAGRRTLLFVDEIHRFNRAQQDAFLPYVERGDIVLVGATTENPSFELNSALLSRCRVVVLDPLSVEDLERVVTRALADDERGLARTRTSIEGKALESIVQLASGDARRALTLLELVVGMRWRRGARRFLPETSKPSRSARRCSTTKRGRSTST
jgi:putative ATPase